MVLAREVLDHPLRMESPFLWYDPTLVDTMAHANGLKQRSSDNITRASIIFDVQGPASVLTVSLLCNVERVTIDWYGRNEMKMAHSFT